MEVHDALASIGIQMPYFHPESAAGQYEFVLPPLPPVEAVDTLYQARQCLGIVAERHGLRVTLHPLPFVGAGSGAHMHVSLNSENLLPDEIQEKGKHFWASVLEHMESICAFSLAEKESYGRVAVDHWTSGIWVAWGTQNREMPLRKSAENRWEIRCIDGFANMYLVLAVILAAGVRGIEEQTEEVIKDCPRKFSFLYPNGSEQLLTTPKNNAARLTDDQRGEYGITKKLPTTLEDALSALQEDEVLAGLLPESMAKNYVTMKYAEMEMLGKMEDWERRIWLIERY
jgi:glutamine synthetase